MWIHDLTFALAAIALIMGVIYLAGCVFFLDMIRRDVKRWDLRPSSEGLRNTDNDRI